MQIGQCVKTREIFYLLTNLGLNHFNLTSSGFIDVACIIIIINIMIIIIFIIVTGVLNREGLW